jgi:hypothetical protein
VKSPVRGKINYQIKKRLKVSYLGVFITIFGREEAVRESVILALWRLRQEFEVSLGFLVTLSQKKKADIFH